MKPIIFLDFDRTLFDLDRFMGEYLGYRHEEHVLKFKEFLMSDPLMDISQYLYPDTIPFLKKAGETHTRVLLSRARTFPEYQRKKIIGSRVLEYLDDIVVTPDDNKGSYAIPFLSQNLDDIKDACLFLDDNLDALRSMEVVAPYVKRILVDRRRKTSILPSGADMCIADLSGVVLKK